MAKFKTQGSTLLAQHFGALNASALEPLLVAVLTSQLEMPRRKFLDALRQYCRLTLKEASAVVSTLVRKQWLVDSSRWNDNLSFGPTLWFNCAEHLSATSLKSINCDERTFIRMGQYVRIDQYRAWLFLTHAVLNGDPVSEESLKVIKSMTGDSWDLQRFFEGLDDILGAQLQDARHVEVLRALPKAQAEALMGKFVSQLNFKRQIDRKRLALFREFAPRSHFLMKYAFFYELWHQGIAVAKSNVYSTSYYYYLITALEVILLKKDYKGALQCAREALKQSGCKGHFETFWENWIYGLCLYYNKDNGVVRRSMQAFIKKLENKAIETIGLKLWCMLALSEDTSDVTDHWSYLPNIEEYREAMAMLGVMLVKYADPEAQLGNYAKLSLKSSELHGIVKLEAMIAFKADPEKIQALSTELSMTSIMPAEIGVVEPWERLLDKLILAEGQSSAPSTVSKERIIYLVSTDNWVVVPRLQKSKDGVKWSKGRDVALKTFAHGEIEGLSPQDQSIARAVQQYRYGRTIEYYFEKSLVWPALVGHPHVYDIDDPDYRIEVRERPLTLSVEEKADGYVVSDNIEVGDARFANAIVSFDGTDIFVCSIDERSSEILLDLNRQKTFPLAAKDKLTQLLGRLANRMTVMSDLTNAAVKTVKGNVCPFFRFDQSIPGEFVITMGLHPISGSTLICEPGVGPENLSATQKGKRVAVHRQLNEELAAKERVLAKLADYKIGEPELGMWSVSASECLGFLEALHDMKDDVVIEWSDHVDYRVNHSKIQSNQCSISVRRLGQWFEVEGVVTVSPTLKLTLREILEKLRDAKVPGYIELSEGEFVAITEQLRQQLMMMEGLIHQTKKSLTLPRYAVNVIDDLTDVGVDINADSATHELMDCIRMASSLTEEVPSQLTAELRDYQIDGFRWMSRLAHWGAGGILADDMGLGKTVQTITLMLSRASEGPSLVVLPTSVLLNWQAELRRFAPSLRVVNYNLEDRESVLSSLGAGDVMLSTYGVMANDIERIKDIHWNVVVLDEAHTIKSKETKTSKASMMLKAQCRLLLTGTPLQNHLGELWNLLEFANPGYLGTYGSFVERFVMPIERDRNKEKQRQLKRMISPFILRRTKTDVLDELPEKTDITLRIELSDEEKALYEHIREKTAEDLESGEINPMEAIVALTRLRQAACHPKLINPQLTFESSKTQAFLKLVEELHTNGHRALVFSQFTSHLALVREALDALKIEYLYLDGAVSAAQRTKLTEAFRLGKMPLFLISLKAGGTGLNLTAADYVIHLDPWWNPAIEDQASDRAYRIGQERPVTVYRLVSEGTIEEKILRLHDTKRSLADALLEGADMSSRLSKEALLALLSTKDEDGQ